MAGRVSFFWCCITLVIVGEGAVVPLAADDNLANASTLLSFIFLPLNSGVPGLCSTCRRQVTQGSLDLNSSELKWDQRMCLHSRGNDWHGMGWGVVSVEPGDKNLGWGSWGGA